MEATLKKAAWWSRIVLVVCISVGCWGCDRNKEKVSDTAAEEKAASVIIDPSPSENAAADAARVRREQERALPRTLSFEMIGTATLPKEGTEQEREAAATQAAIIDSFCKALMEARQSRGQTTTDFTARLGPRLMLTHCTVEDGDEVHVEVISRGVATTFIVRNGVLQHPPHDWKAIDKIFEETNGEFSLLETSHSELGKEHFARVGCYLPQGFEPIVAGAESSEESEETP